MERTHEPFRTTRWTELRALVTQDPQRRREALDVLIGRYWPPVYAYLRGRGHARDDAAELTQGFFVDVVLHRDLFDRADPARGRLRSLLLTALQRYCVDRHRRRVPRRCANRPAPRQIELEEANLERLLGEPADPDLVFDRSWALALLARALRRAEAHYVDAGKPGHWSLFSERVLVPALRDTTPLGLADVCTKHGFANAARAAAAVQVVRQRVSVILRELVAETLDEGADVEAELADIRRILAS